MRGLQAKGKRLPRLRATHPGGGDIARRAIEFSFLFGAQWSTPVTVAGCFRTMIEATSADAPKLPDAQDAVARLLALREQIARRARDCGRGAGGGQARGGLEDLSAEEVWPTIESAGQTRFGENRVQEAIPKWGELRARAGGLGKGIELHLIGPLQSNKAREAVETFDVIETVDRGKDRRCARRAKSSGSANVRACLSRSTSEGDRRRRASLPRDADAFIALCRQTYGFDNRGPHEPFPRRTSRSRPFRPARRHRGTQWDITERVASA